jgi:hypothetical protein
MDEIPQFPASQQEAPQGRPLSSSSIVSPDLPEDWGGRPKGNSRRAIRMQAEYDKRREQTIDEAKAFQEMDIQRKQFEMQSRDQQLQEDEFYYNRGLKEAEQKLQAQQRSEAAAIIGGLNQLDPRSPDYQKNVATLFGQNPLGATDEGVQKVWGQYGAASEVYNNSLVTQSEQQKKDAEEQAQIQADIVKYDLTPEQQSKMLVPNLPAGVVRFDPNKAKPVIAEAEKAIEGREETKATEKESESRFDDYNKAFAAYEGLAGDKQAQPEEVAKARAAARGAAAVLRIPKVANENDLQNYNSGDRVLAPDGITVITIP